MVQDKFWKIRKTGKGHFLDQKRIPCPPPPPPPLFPEGKIKGNKGPNIVQTQISNFRTENLHNVKYYKDINVCKR